MQKLETESQRRHAVAWAIAMTTGTKLAPTPYERELLEQYAQGTLTLDQVLMRLDQRVHHLVYRSRAVSAFSTKDLTAMQQQSQARNEAHDITGLLCYSKGHFVQVLEGSEAEVHALFAKVQQDKRHDQVQVLSERASSHRWFADWRMALVQTNPADLQWLLGYLAARSHNLMPPQVPLTQPHLLTLLTAFSNS